MVMYVSEIVTPPFLETLHMYCFREPASHHFAIIRETKARIINLSIAAVQISQGFHFSWS